MYLKSLELQGFKSFPEKVKLTFDKGMTGVVGPNGSGKSNIGDAVRWVLGEQSTKTLRGNKMEDVIFSGTTKRKPVSFAAVTLYIDNTERKLHFDNDEVSITRKLYRNGDSEYRINGKNVRLKDVNELFMDTGIGRDGYSIIGQGRIAEIVGAKSTDRRDIFEEAAGISKFRYKKEEAQKKLIQAEDNIVRLQDIVAELESRILPLKTQAEKAQKFIVLAEEKRKIEISLWINKIDEYKKNIDKLKNDLLIYNSNYEVIESKISENEDKMQSIYSKMKETSIKIDEYKNFILEIEKKSSEYKSNIAVFLNEIEYLQKELPNIEERKNTNNSNLECNIIKVDEISIKLKENLKMIKDYNNKILELETEFKSIDDLASSLDINFDKTGDFLNANYIKQSEINLKIQSSKNNILEMEKELVVYDDDILKSTNEINQAKIVNQSKVDELSNLINYEQELKNKSLGFEKIFEVRTAKLNIYKEEYEKSLFSQKEKQNKLKVLNDLESNMEGFNYSVKEIIKASKSSKLSGVCGSVADLLNVDEKYALAIETALGSSLQNIVVENEEYAKRCIKYLQELKKGRATFLPLTSIKAFEFNEKAVFDEMGFINLGVNLVKFDMKYKNIVYNLLGRIVISEDIDIATHIAKKYNYKFKIVTLDGQVINAGGSFTGGSKLNNVGVLTRKSEIEKLNFEIDNLLNENEITSKKILNKKMELDKINAEIDILKKEQNEKMALNYKYNSEIQSSSSFIAQLEKNINSLFENKSKYTSKIEIEKKNISILKTQLENISMNILELEKNIKEEQDKKSTLQEKRKIMAESISEIKMNIMILEKDNQVIEYEKNRYFYENDKIKNEIENLKNEIKYKNALILEKNSSIEICNEKLLDIKLTIEKYNENIKDNVNIHNEYEKSTNELRTELKNLNIDREKISREISRFDEKINSQQKEFDDITLELWETYELTRSEAQKLAEPINDVLKTQKKLNDIKSQIKALGSVNVSAVDEFKEVSERYTFMKKQLDDICISKKEIQKLISDLTEEMKVIFAECFQKINYNFKNIFVELFDGGKAELVLTEPENILESGIEIVVAPPGKVIKNLIALSGGEQAFVAIAIYFAILTIKPVPFCILDEIDAALDEVNVRKYAVYLKKFTDNTQFIIVTHRRGTMEAANVLYGVTMQENGISKLLKMQQVDIPDEIMQ